MSSWLSREVLVVSCLPPREELSFVFSCQWKYEFSAVKGSVSCEFSAVKGSVSCKFSTVKGSLSFLLSMELCVVCFLLSREV